MLIGEHYMLFNPQLVDEREQCKASLFRFNNGSNPGGGISREERARLFREVLEPKWVKSLRAPHSQNPIGSLGKDVCVDAPFTCEYGYNINIGDEVVLGSNCTILDPCRIIIGARTIIGPNVNIFGNTVSTDPRARKGSKGTACGKEVIIEEDVYIGGNVTILPGVTIGKGATVGAGSVVTHVSSSFVLELRVEADRWSSPFPNSSSQSEIPHEFSVGSGSSSTTDPPQSISFVFLFLIEYLLLHLSLAGGDDGV
jgi:acetyltransferase-like isoleucine patch superfamily enzyme